MSMTQTTNGGNTHDHSGTHAVEFFSKAGSLFVQKQASSDTTALALFKNVWRSGDHELAMKLLFWLRDPRGGAGNRSGFRAIASWLADEAPEWMTINAIQIPKYGRYDDLTALYGSTLTAGTAAHIWANDILAGNVLAAKWADRADKKVLKAVRLLSNGVKDIGDYRRLLSKLRNGLVEVAMSNDEMGSIDYSKVPSVAMARYSSAFDRKDAKRFTAYKTELEQVLESGDTNSKVKMNAGVVFPHDIVRSVFYGGDKKTCDLQFASLPNFMEESGSRVLTLCDTSGSMGCQVGGPQSKVQAIHVSTALSLYCSDKLDKDNPFYRRYIQFGSESVLTNWSKETSIYDVLRNRKYFNGAVRSTNIEKALTSILTYAKDNKATSDDMPTHILIVSDMQFDSHQGPQGSDATVVEACMQDWDDSGYARPNIIYWNTRGAEGSAEKATTPNTAMISGFSPAILKAVFGNPDSMQPENIMMDAIKDYEVILPK